ncbi:TRAP-type uncharacterized transport system substrate-binding protein [Nitrobacteraceae bacterium AZCC 1564]
MLSALIAAALIAAAWFGGKPEEALAQKSPSVAQTEQAKTEQARAAPRKQTDPGKDSATSASHFTLGLVTGSPQSTEFAVAQDIATTLSSGQETGPRGEVALRVLPMVGNGGSRNVQDVLTLAGADMTIAPVVLVDRLKEAKTFGDIRNKLVTIAPMFSQDFHLIVRPEIKTLMDLAGKKVNLGEEGSAGAELGLELLNGLDVKFDAANLGLDAALDAMWKGQISATVLLSAKPVEPLARYAQFNAVRLLPIPYTPAMQRDYQQSALRHADYPTILGIDETVDTIAVRSALFAYNWPSRSERYRLLEFFVQTFFSRFSEFLGDGHHPKWRELNLAEPLPGWKRFAPAERWLERQAERGKQDRFPAPGSLGTSPDRGAFEEFLRRREQERKQER